MKSSHFNNLQPRRIPPTLPEDSPPPIPAFSTDTIVPDYPGLEYPPVFEPGTYTLNPEAREQWRSSHHHRHHHSNTRHLHTNRTLMLLPKPKDACWPTQSMNLTGASHLRSSDISSQRRIRLTPQEAVAKIVPASSRRLPPQPESPTVSREASTLPPEMASQARRPIVPSNQEAVLIPPLDLLSATDV